MEINEMLQDKKVLAGIAVVVIILILGVAFVFMGGNSEPSKTPNETKTTKTSSTTTTTTENKTKTTPTENKTGTTKVKVETKVISQKELTKSDVQPVIIEYAGGFTFSALDCVKNGNTILITKATEINLGTKKVKAAIIKDGKLYLITEDGKVYVDDKTKIDGTLNCKETNENLDNMIKNAEPLTPEVLIS